MDSTLCLVVIEWQEILRLTQHTIQPQFPADPSGRVTDSSPPLTLFSTIWMVSQTVAIGSVFIKYVLLTGEKGLATPCSIATAFPGLPVSYWKESVG